MTVGEQSEPYSELNKSLMPVFNRAIVEELPDNRLKFSRLSTNHDLLKVYNRGGFEEVLRLERLQREQYMNLDPIIHEPNKLLTIAIESTYGTQIYQLKSLEEKKMVTRNEAEALAIRAAEMLAEIDRIESLYGVDDYENGTIIYLDSQFVNGDRVSQTVYNFAIVKANSFWYISGPNFGGRRYTWDQLVAWFESDSVWIVRLGFANREKAIIKNKKIS